MPQYKPDFSFEDRYAGLVCGIDEAGRGPLAGPVVAAAVVIRRGEMPADILAQIDDSKALTAEKRAFLFSKIYEYAHVSLAEASVVEIDRLNILQASLLAMKKAHAKLRKQMQVPPVAALVDGNQKPSLGRVAIETIVQGDARSFSIAAASIIAKHYRDQLMYKAARKFPQYGWETNAGYGTPEHLKAIEIHGITPLHRRSFAPVSKQLVKENIAND
ncbi:MAG: ribonuclease HII [Alphaproteobacteria bacterium]|nr:MAG: ribonuclease HII [Alphaproteobacteria bacterium]